MIFQVTGLPRSGTAFLTTFFNLHPDCFAHHDVASERDDWTAYSEHLEKIYTYVGEVSTYGWLPKATREGPKILIDRDPSEVVRALTDKLDRPFDVGDYIVLRAQALRWADEHGALIVPFEHLFSLGVLGHLWRYVFGAYRFPVEKTRMLVKMNIQRHNPAQMLGSDEEAHKRLYA